MPGIPTLLVGVALLIAPQSVLRADPKDGEKHRE